MSSTCPKETIEILKIRSSTFALAFSTRYQSEESCQEILSTLPECNFNKRAVRDIRNLYNEIKEMRCLSIEEVFTALGLEPEPSDSLKSLHRRTNIKNFRAEICKIIDITMEQIKKNITKIDLCKLTYRIFYSMQSFRSDKPYYIASQWFLGNSNEKNEVMREAFEHYTLSSLKLRNNPEFCLEAILKLLKTIKLQINSSFRTLFLDNILDHIYHWYFVYSESSYDFLIFMPDAFDDIRDFLLDMMDHNPFALYLHSNGKRIEKIGRNECCLDANDMLGIDLDVVENFSSLRELGRNLEKYYTTYKALNEYGIFTCACYDVSELIEPGIKPVIEILIDEVSQRINEFSPILTYPETIQDRQDFMRYVVKPDIIKQYFKEDTSRQSYTFKAEKSA